jgi:hypothetical protein
MRSFNLKKNKKAPIKQYDIDYFSGGTFLLELWRCFLTYGMLPPLFKNHAWGHF